MPGSQQNFFRPQYSLSLTQIRTLKTLWTICNTMCEFIITALHIHNCVFNEKKMKKKKSWHTHTPFSILPYINSDHLVHKYKRNTRDQIYKKNHLLFYSNTTRSFFRQCAVSWACNSLLRGKLQFCCCYVVNDEKLVNYEPLRSTNDRFLLDNL